MADAVFWIVTGKYIDEARRSAASVAREMPGVWRVLFTPESGVEKGNEFGEVIGLPPRISTNWFLDCTRYLTIALKALEREGMDRLIYLDSDTYAVAPFPELFDLLGRFDLAGAHAPGRETCQTVKPLPISFPELNVGVLAMWNRSEMQNFAIAWYERYRQYEDVYRNNDQGALRECLWEYANYLFPTEFRFYVFPPEFNVRPIGIGAYLRGRARILHMRGDCMDNAIRTVNQEVLPRLWKP